MLYSVGLSRNSNKTTVGSTSRALLLNKYYIQPILPTLMTRWVSSIKSFLTSVPTFSFFFSKSITSSNMTQFVVSARDLWVLTRGWTDSTHDRIVSLLLAWVTPGIYTFTQQNGSVALTQHPFANTGLFRASFPPACRAVSLQVWRQLWLLSFQLWVWWNR